MPVESYSTTPANNNAAPPFGAPESMLPRDLNNVIRQNMADLAVLLRQFPWIKLSTGLTVERNSATQFQLTGVDATAIFSPGRRVREVGATTAYGTVSASAYTSGNTLVDVTNDAAAAIPTSLTAVDVAVVDANAVTAISLETIPVLAAAMLPATTSGCAPLAQTEVSAGFPELISLDFDGSSAEYALFSVPLPKRWNKGTITARFAYTVSSAVVTTVTWGLQAVAVSDGEPIATAFGTAQYVTDTFHGVANRLAVTAATSAISVANSPADGDHIFFRVRRDPSVDTTSQDARLVCVEVFFTANSGTDD